MRRCFQTGLHAAARRPRPKLCLPPATICGLCLVLPFSVHSPSQEQDRSLRKYPIFDRIDPPKRRIDEWTALLDGALPPHLRDWTRDRLPPITLSATDVAEILIAAQYDFRGGNREGFDLLFELGFQQARWSAVVWLIKSLVEKFPARHGKPSHFSGVNALWEDVISLDKIVAKPINLPLDQKKPLPTLVDVRSLSDITAGCPEHLSPQETLQHDALGQIWRTLGAMTRACAGGEIRPEILEIIAYLHHREIMPLSIYRSDPNPDRNAIQQPPLLSLLSSRILTSLSDAAWRAHEKLVVEEAKARGGEYAALRPEVPGSMYKVQVAGLRPEVWMELILWSCIHGGWVSQGAEILDLVVHDDAREQNSQWRALSWQEYEKSIAADSVSRSDWKYSFKTRAASTKDDPQGPHIQIQRTISAEVINTYIDAIVSTTEIGVGDRGSDISDVVLRIRRLQKFLYRAPSRLTLSFGSWDGLCLRLIENSSVVPETDIGLLRKILRLSPGFSYGLASKNAQSLPDYVLDGNAAIHGFFHRALYGEIMSGSYGGAVAIFRDMQQNADTDRVKSLVEFMKGREGRQPLLRSLSESEIFTSNLTGIEYPAFDMQIPPTLLGSLLDLITDAQAYEFGHWLLHNRDVDEPVIGEMLYRHSHVQPAIIRFAANANDQTLLAKFRYIRPSRDSLRAILDSQIDTSKWDAAARILEHLADTPGSKWTIHNLAVIVRGMLRHMPSANSEGTEGKQQLKSAMKLFTDVISLRYNGDEKLNGWKKSQMRNLLVVLSAVDPGLARLCSRFRPATNQLDNFALNVDAFNVMLEGVVSAYGSAAGRRLLKIFWPYSARNAHDAVVRLRSRIDGRRRMPRFQPRILNSIQRQRIVVSCSGSLDQQEEIVLHGALEPNTKTVLIILWRSLKEIRTIPNEITLVRPGTAAGETQESHHYTKSIDFGLRGMVRWAIRRLAELPYVASDIVEQIDGVLVEQGLEDIRADLSAIFRSTAAEIAAEAAEPHKTIDGELDSASQ